MRTSEFVGLNSRPGINPFLDAVVAEAHYHAKLAGVARVKRMVGSYMKPVATLVMLMVLTPAAAAPIPAVKSAQCPPGHMQSGGYCTPMFRVAPAVVPKVERCSYCAEMRLRPLGPYGH
jgi:hypothetical protein